MLSSCPPGEVLLSFPSIKQPGCAHSDTLVYLSAARLVSSVQAVMATSAGYIIASSCEDIIEDQ